MQSQSERANIIKKYQTTVNSPSLLIENLQDIGCYRNNKIVITIENFT
jgi:hypothetical protein